MSDKGQLFVVGTPIGNLEDITLRAISTLQNIDMILAEDTRNSKKLLDAHNIDTKMISYHDHSSEKEIKKIVNLLLDEGSILLGSGNYSIRFRPHLNVTEDDINFGMDCFRKALNKLS